MDLRRLHLSLFAAQLVGLATLFRSVAYDRWITVLASVLLIAGATAARRGRSWGVGLALGAAAAFPVAWAIGIAPAWFCLVGLVGAWPFVLASKAFARFDKGATALLAFLAASAGTIGAIAWKAYAWSIFMEFPSLWPSREAQHGLGLVALTAITATAAVVMRQGRSSIPGEPQLRVAPSVRIGQSSSSLGEGGETAAAFEELHEDEHDAPAARRRLP